MVNTINLLPIRSKDQIKKEIKKFKYDLITAVGIMAVVIIGVFIMFINSVLQFSVNSLTNKIKSATVTLNTYKPIAAQYYTVAKKVDQVKIIKSNRTNPNDVIYYLQSLMPTGSSLANFRFDASNAFTVSISSTNYIDIAKLLIRLEDRKLRLRNTEITAITYDHVLNSVQFVITGSYQKNE